MFRGGVTPSSDKGLESKVAFTLAEVLITLGIIGVVAAITMPVLLSNVQDRVKQKRVENIQQKLSKVTDKMAVQSGLTGYGDTMSFVQEMSRHMKLAKICDNGHISDCWPTQEVILDDKGKTWKISKTKNAKNLKINKNVVDNWADTVGIVTADGTAMILSYDKTCTFNVDDDGLTYSNDTGKSNSLVCLSGVFDWNGGKNPNKLGKDVITLGVAKGLGNSCALEIGNLCFSAPFTPTPLTRAKCEEQKGTLGIKGCYYEKDFWAGAVAECGGVKSMPTMAQLGQLATKLYKSHPTVGPKQDVENLRLDTSAVTAMGFTGSSFSVWSGSEKYNNGLAYYRYFDSSETYYDDRPRSLSDVQAVCVGD